MNLFQNIGRGTDDDIIIVRAYIADNMEQSGGVLSEDSVWNFMKPLLNKTSEYEARIEGTPKHFSGVILDELDKDVHLVEEFSVPVHWSFYEGVDPAEGKPVAWGFFAVSPDEFELTEHRIVNSVYLIDYLKLDGMSISAITRAVNQKRAEWGYKRPISVVLDQKYGLATQTTGDNITNWYTELRRYDPGINYTLSNSKPGSIETGEKIIKEYLKPKYHNLKEREVPTFQIFKRCEHPYDTFCPVTHLFNYAADEDRTSKRTEEYKDFVDLCRYVLEKYPRYWPPDQADKDYPKKKHYFTREN